ncbi:hypothetical protein E4U61_008036 [Claviceps capensis]|nr:hypothetical protein E4U61_008036 [Claviceps capensis]
MPKKDYGEPTRKFARLGAQSLERSVKHEEVEEPALSTSRPESSPASPEPVEPAATTDTEPEGPVASIESDQYDSAEEIHAQSVVTSKPPRNTEHTHHRTTPSPAPETNMSATDNNNNNNDNAAGGKQDNMASITTLLQSLVDRLDRLEQMGSFTRSPDREITPTESVFWRRGVPTNRLRRTTGV